MKKNCVLYGVIKGLLLVNLLFYSCAGFTTNSINATILKSVSVLDCAIELDSFPVVLLNAQNGNVVSYFDYEIVNSPLSEEGAKIFNDNIIYRITETYILSGKENIACYYAILFDFNKTVVNTEGLKQGDIIGRGNDSKLLVFSQTMDPFLVINCNVKPVFYDGFYWFDGLFLLGGSRDWFSFEQTESIENILNDKSGQQAPTALAVPTRGVKLFNMFRYSFKCKLSEYPELMTQNERQNVMVIENMIFGRSITTHINEIQMGQNKIILCWQSGYSQYLRDEYTLNDDIWLYSMSMAYNQFLDTYYLFLIDFKLETLEDMYENRIKQW